MKPGCTRTAMAFWLVAALFIGSLQAPAAQKQGETGFKEHCAACHAEGGNIIKPDKTLSRADREKHGVVTAADIVALMRKPGEGMSPFDIATIPDREAYEIADYIIETFR